MVALMRSVQGRCDPIALSNVTAGCAPLTVYFNCPNFNTGTAVWSVNSTTMAGLTASISLPTPGTYIATLTLVLDATCQGTSTTVVNVVTGPAFDCSTTVAVAEEFYDESMVEIYPNPTSAFLNISFSSLHQDITTYRIIDNLGRCILEQEIHSNPFSVPTSNLVPGLYQINLKKLSGFLTKKFVKSE